MTGDYSSVTLPRDCPHTLQRRRRARRFFRRTARRARQPRWGTCRRARRDARVVDRRPHSLMGVYAINPQYDQLKKCVAARRPAITRRSPCRAIARVRCNDDDVLGDFSAVPSDVLGSRDGAPAAERDARHAASVEIFDRASPCLQSIALLNTSKHDRLSTFSTTPSCLLRFYCGA